VNLTNVRLPGPWIAAALDEDENARTEVVKDLGGSEGAG
jgi:hypothetical protein